MITQHAGTRPYADPTPRQAPTSDRPSTSPTGAPAAPSLTPAQRLIPPLRTRDAPRIGMRTRGAGTYRWRVIGAHVGVVDKHLEPSDLPGLSMAFGVNKDDVAAPVRTRPQGEGVQLAEMFQAKANYDRRLGSRQRPRQSQSHSKVFDHGPARLKEPVYVCLKLVEVSVAHVVGHVKARKAEPLCRAVETGVRAQMRLSSSVDPRLGREPSDIHHRAL